MKGVIKLIAFLAIRLPHAFVTEASCLINPCTADNDDTQAIQQMDGGINGDPDEMPPDMNEEPQEESSPQKILTIIAEFVHSLYGSRTDNIDDDEEEDGNR